jgi:hypothetical protein
MSPSLLLFRSLWTTGFDLDAALADCGNGLFDGVEGPVPLKAPARREFARRLTTAGVPFIAEVVTGGGYVPDHRSCERHLEDFRRQAGAACECAPLLLTVLGGCDSWPPGQSAEFFDRATGFARELGVEASFETHRSRPTFNPWATRDLLERLPALRLTGDFSHWCCVCERLVLDEEPELLACLAPRIRHLHARVGYAQGPQVPHPAAPEHRAELEAHERWWDAVWSAQAARNQSRITMTAEFGPDGYLHRRPFTGEPAADLDETNRWMAARERARFEVRFGAAAGVPARN